MCMYEREEKRERERERESQNSQVEEMKTCFHKSEIWTLKKLHLFIE